MNKTEILNLLTETQEATKRYFDLPNQTMDKNYGDGKWNIRQILHHITDAEYVLHVRLKRIIAEPRQVIWAFNQDDWNNAFNYVSEPLHDKKECFFMCRLMNIKLVKDYFDSHSQKEFIHSETGLRTLGMEMEKLATHNLKHNNQIELALKK